MRSPDDARYAAIARGLLTLSLVAGVSACGTTDEGSRDAGLARAIPASGAQSDNSPRADYPIIVGAPYSVNGVEYVPADVLNYDHVGYLAEDRGAVGYTGAHHTLPLPSYVEVTSLDTGRTMLVRLERRGPMDSTHLLALSSAALVQLGATAEAPVRVRRVNPPETQRYLLRAGEPAPLRMDTPASLLTVLQRRLPEAGAAPLRAANAPIAAPPETESTIETVELAASEAAPALPPVATTIPAPQPEAAPPRPAVVASNTPPALPSIDSVDAGDADSPIATPPPAASAPRPAADGTFLVQAAAFSTMERAERAAEALDGAVTPSGRYFRVRTGPFATRGEAEASLANVRRAGYTDARILTSG